MPGATLLDIGLPAGLMEELKAGFQLDWQGLHGARHWARVMHHGLHLASRTGADLQVVRLFAVLHDSQRANEGADAAHGQRAAGFVLKQHADRRLGLDDTRADWLAQACMGHSEGGTRANSTIATCWDADRLDLGRVGIRPDPRRLCTREAADASYIDFAWRWSRGVAVAASMRPGHRG